MPRTFEEICADYYATAATYQAGINAYGDSYTNNTLARTCFQAALAVSGPVGRWEWDYNIYVRSKWQSMNWEIFQTITPAYDGYNDIYPAYLQAFYYGTAEELAEIEEDRVWSANTLTNGVNHYNQYYNDYSVNSVRYAWDYEAAELRTEALENARGACVQARDALVPLYYHLCDLYDEYIAAFPP